MDEKIILKDEHFIAQGGERICYLHPLDNTKVIKIISPRDRVLAYNGERNLIEYKYFNFLDKLNIPFTHITKCYSYIDTNLGEGLVFDKVYDYNGEISKTFLELVKFGNITKEQEENLISELKEYIIGNNILFIDYAFGNILCCEYDKNRYKLVIIDGLGAKRCGFKFWLYLNSKIYTKYKVRVQWNRFIKRYENFKKNQVRL